MSRCADQGTVIAQATAEEPYRFILGANNVIKGFEIAVEFLGIGSAATFFIPSDLAYGKVGQPPDILDNEDLVSEIELLSARDIDTSSISIMNDETKYVQAEEYKQRANTAYKAQQYDEAL